MLELNFIGLEIRTSDVPALLIVEIVPSNFESQKHMYRFVPHIHFVWDLLKAELAVNTICAYLRANQP